MENHQSKIVDRKTRKKKQWKYGTTRKQKMAVLSIDKPLARLSRKKEKTLVIKIRNERRGNSSGYYRNTVDYKNFMNCYPLINWTT